MLLTEFWKGQAIYELNNRTAKEIPKAFQPLKLGQVYIYIVFRGVYRNIEKLPVIFLDLENHVSLNT